MATGVRSTYHIAINSKGFMLRGAPTAPVYQKEKAPSLVNQLGIGDLDYNSLNGAGWSFWTQTDWSGGFQVEKFKDDASFKDGQAVDTLKKYGQVTLQYGWLSAAKITGGHAYGTHAVHEKELLFGTARTAGAKLFKLTSANNITALSAYTSAISQINDIARFGDYSIIGLSRTGGSLKTMARYNGSALSAFRSVNSVVRAVHSIGIRLYSAEKVTAFSGDVLYYATNLSAFTSAYKAGKNRLIKEINDVAGAPYFFVQENNRVEMFRWDEVAERAYPIYSWENLINFKTKKYFSYLMITGKSNNKSVAYTFDGAKIQQVFDDQLRDQSYDFSKPFEQEDNLQVKGAQWDGQFWGPGIYGKFDANNNWTPFENFNNTAYGYFTSGSHTRLGYRTSGLYAISGHVVSSEFGSNIAGIDKMINSVDINMEALATGQTIELLKSVDGGATFTSIGKTSYAQDGAVTKKTMFFPSGYVTKLFNYKSQLVGPGTSTPTLKDVTFQYRPIPDLKKRWHLSVDAGNDVVLLNKQRETRDGKAIMQDLWLEMETKRTIIYEDVDAFETPFISAMAAGATSARVASTRGMAPRGRIRVRKSGILEEMSYLSADGGSIKGISRGQKGTLARAYTSADKIDNFYNVIVTDITEMANNTDQNKTESIARVVLLEA